MTKHETHGQFFFNRLYSIEMSHNEHRWRSKPVLSMHSRFLGTLVGLFLFFYILSSYLACEVSEKRPAIWIQSYYIYVINMYTCVFSDHFCYWISYMEAWLPGRQVKVYHMVFPYQLGEFWNHSNSVLNKINPRFIRWLYRLYIYGSFLNVWT